MYGLTILRENDPLVTIAEEAMEAVMQAAVPGRFLVDTLPICERSSIFYIAWCTC